MTHAHAHVRTDTFAIPSQWISSGMFDAACECVCMCVCAILWVYAAFLSHYKGETKAPLLQYFSQNVKHLNIRIAFDWFKVNIVKSSDKNSKIPTKDKCIPCIQQIVSMFQFRNVRCCRQQKPKIHDEPPLWWWWWSQCCKHQLYSVC